MTFCITGVFLNFFLYVCVIAVEIREAVKMLYLLHQETEAAQLQSQFDTLLTNMDNSVAEIWNCQQPTTQTSVVS